MRGGRERPENERAGERLLHAEFVDEESDERREHRVREGECRGDPSVVDVIPSERALQRGLEHRKRIAVDVVDGRREEQQRADEPAEVANAAGAGAAGIATGVHYPILDCDQMSELGLPGRKMPMPVSERARDEILSLPCYPSLTEAEINQVTRALTGF